MKAKLVRRTVDALKPGKERYDVFDSALPGFKLRVSPTGKMVYLLRFKSPNTGLWTQMTIGDAAGITPEQARNAAKASLRIVAEGRDPLVEKRAKHAEAAAMPTLGEFLDGEYGVEVKHSRKSGEATVARLKSTFKSFLKRPLSGIVLRDVEKWRVDRLKDGRAVTTVNRDAAALRACLSKAVDRDILPAHPLRKFKLMKIDRAPKVRYLGTMTVDGKEVSEEEALMKALDTREAEMANKRENYNVWAQERDYPERPNLTHAAFSDYLKPLVLTLVHTGMRRGEAFNLEWKDVDLEALHPALTVRGESAKSGTTRVIPLNTVAVDVLKKWRKQTGGVGLVFRSPKGGGRMDNVQTAWESLLTDAGIKNFRLHDLRHTFASKLVMAGVDLNTVRELLGHGSIAMTLRYAHLGPQTKALAVEKIVASRKAGTVIPFTEPKKQNR
ncbi:MAG: site-specific integrase [Candidatus Hydrogenedentes bacterium]|nr:site-specific integrase [Candidatus Hydrogenedentota bacterium]